MGGTSRDRCLVALRPFLLAILLTVAWLAWAAGSANAASEEPNPLGAIEQATVSVLQDAGSTFTPARPDVPAHAAAVPFPVSGTAAAVANVADRVPGEAIDVTVVVNRAAPQLTDSLADTVVTDTDTVAGTVDTAVSVVDSLAPDLPGVPVPTVPPSGFDAVTAAPARVGPEATARAGSQAAKDTAAAPQQARRAVSPLEFLANTQALRALAATIGYVVSAAPAPTNAAEPEQVFRFAALQNQSGSASAGSGSVGADASADVAAFWNILHDARSGLMRDAALVPAAGPSFDPGSSPD
ncbi:hypothetical protein [Arthrobacter sp. ISL-69]|uniref:hypothetical protein n=1 Tax=Arthrobacter sp. ISL-69 TaxID=2819113 RepID=UPI001BE53D06|nr:hypothetical protein [Arthrobacter sp. ISL-69]MBT2538397.1 hypothetical protein [Arthrobacter sp. ISL-69]